MIISHSLYSQAPLSASTSIQRVGHIQGKCCRSTQFFYTYMVSRSVVMIITENSYINLNLKLLKAFRYDKYQKVVSPCKWVIGIFECVNAFLKVPYCQWCFREYGHIQILSSWICPEDFLEDSIHINDKPDIGPLSEETLIGWHGAHKWHEVPLLCSNVCI